MKRRLRLSLIWGCLVPSILVALLIIGLGSWLWFTGYGRWQPPHEIVHPEQVVKDARRLIDHFSAAKAPEQSHISLEPNDLPPSLQIKGTSGARVFHDHLSLILDHSPDTQRGIRVWDTTATVRHADQPSLYPGIFWYRYCNDEPISDENLP